MKIAFFQDNDGTTKAPLLMLRILSGFAEGGFIADSSQEISHGVTGRKEVWERLGGSLVVDPGKLMAAGWQPDPDTRTALARMAAASLSVRSHT